MSKVVLMTSNCLAEPLAVSEPAEVERCAPAVLIEVGCEIVVAALVRYPDVLKELESETDCLVRVAYSAFRA